MNAQPYMLVNGTSVSFGEIWVHLKSAPPQGAVPLTVFIPANCFEAATGEAQLKVLEESRADFLRRQIRDFGTFIVEAYFKKLREIVGDRSLKKSWALVSVKGVEENSDGVILISG